MPQEGPGDGELETLLEDVAARLDEGDAEGALDAARRGEKLARRLGDEEARADLVLLQGMALSQMGEPRQALARIDAALALRPDDLDALVERGLALLEGCRFEEARAQLLEAVRRDPDDAWAQHALGIIAERSGEEAEAERRFARARRLEPEEFRRPVGLSQARFDAAVEDALASLPEPVRRYLSNVAIAVEDFPAEDDLVGADPPLSPSILGVFRGSPLGDKASMDPWNHFPSSIVLYQKNLQRAARDARELVDEIAVTLIHEVGHFLGLDEDELRERGLE